MRYRTGIGQDSHRFLNPPTEKPCVIGGCLIDNVPGFDADSDGDVIFHSLCNAISSITHVPILGGIAIDLNKRHGITNSQVFVEEALKTLVPYAIEHVAFSLEGSRPRMQSDIVSVRKKVAQVLNIDSNNVGVTVTSGDGLTAFGRGEGVMCYCLLTVYH